MNDRIVLQVPMSKDLRRQAEEVAQDVGFSSLQEVIRLFVQKFVRRELAVKIENIEIVKLSSEAKSRLQTIEKDISRGKNLYLFENTDDLLRKLRS